MTNEPQKRRRQKELAENRLNQLNIGMLRGTTDGQEVIRDCERKRDLAVQRYNEIQLINDRIPLFVSSMNELEREMKATLDVLFKDYDTISFHLSTFMKECENFQVRGTLSGLVQTPGCDNGEEIRVYFLETGPPRDENALTQGATP